MCDLGANVNLMSLFVYKKLNLREVKLTIISLLMVDQSIRHLRGILKDVLVKVDKFIFLANFIVLEMEKKLRNSYYSYVIISSNWKNFN